MLARMRASSVMDRNLRAIHAVRIPAIPAGARLDAVSRCLSVFLVEKPPGAKASRGYSTFACYRIAAKVSQRGCQDFLQIKSKHRLLSVFETLLIWLSWSLAWILQKKFVNDNAKSRLRSSFIENVTFRLQWLVSFTCLQIDWSSTITARNLCS